MPQECPKCPNICSFFKSLWKEIKINLKRVLKKGQKEGHLGQI